MSAPKAYSGKNKFIFVSYSHRDTEIVLPFIANLQKQYNVWFDEGIHFGKEWEDEIAEKLLKCELFIFMVSENSLASSNCKDEIHMAREKGKNFINVMMKPTDVSDAFALRYSRYQTCKLYTYSDYESAIRDMESKCEWFSSCLKEHPKDVENDVTPIVHVKEVKIEEKPVEKNPAKPKKEKKFNYFKDVMLRNIFFDVIVGLHLTMTLVFLIASANIEIGYIVASFLLAAACAGGFVILFLNKIKNKKAILAIKIAIIVLTLVVLVLMIVALATGNYSSGNYLY